MERCLYKVIVQAVQCSSRRPPFLELSVFGFEFSLPCCHPLSEKADHNVSRMRRRLCGTNIVQDHQFLLPSSWASSSCQRLSRPYSNAPDATDTFDAPDTRAKIPEQECTRSRTEGYRDFSRLK